MLVERSEMGIIRHASEVYGESASGFEKFRETASGMVSRVAQRRTAGRDIVDRVHHIDTLIAEEMG